MRAVTRLPQMMSGFEGLSISKDGPHLYDPVFVLSPDGTRYVPAPSNTPTIIPEPRLPFSLVFRCEPGKEDVILKIASAYKAASKRRIRPPAFGAFATE